MKEYIAIGKFKTHCYKLLDQSQKENKQITITRKGKAIAQIVPLRENIKKPSIFGMMKNIASINSDLLDPIDVKWNAQHDR
jgi:antitoxin (DNA-binding transcriptional repressor) of toxin-antitoxin stability system